MTSLGDILRKAREAKGATISEAAEATRIKSSILAAMEVNDYSRIAAPLYARGFIKLYAEFLGMDPAPLIREYNGLLAGRRPAGTAPESESSVPVPRYKAPAVPATPAREGAAPVAVAPSPAARPAASRPAPVAPAVAPPKATAPSSAPRAEFRLEAETAQREALPGPLERKSPLAAPASPRPAAKSPGPVTPPRPPGPLPAGLRYLPVGIGIALVIVLIVSALNRCAKQAQRAPAPAVTTAPAPVSVPAATPPVRPAVNSSRLRLSEDPPAPYLKMKP